MGQPYYGLRGPNLGKLMILSVVLPCFLLYGYLQADAGGLLALPSFNATFPSISTVGVTGELENHRALIQGSIISPFNKLGANCD